MDKNILYTILRPITSFFTNILLRPTYIGREYIPKEGRIILAGNHTHNLDCFLLTSATKRKVHFLAKKELWHGPKKLFFDNLGFLHVDRTTKNPEALSSAIKYLENDLLIGIFPEGTTEKGRGLLPFKYGAVKIASVANSQIVPFVIKGQYRLFSKDLKIIFNKPISISKDNLTDSNNKLQNTIKNDKLCIQKKEEEINKLETKQSSAKTIEERISHEKAKLFTI